MEFKKNGEAGKEQIHLKLTLSHAEIAQMIGSTRDTVTRLFADLKKRCILQVTGSTLVIRDMSALKLIAANS